MLLEEKNERTKGKMKKETERLRERK